jgi:hypothetical protein
VDLSLGPREKRQNSKPLGPFKNRLKGWNCKRTGSHHDNPECGMRSAEWLRGSSASIFTPNTEFRTPHSGTSRS